MNQLQIITRDGVDVVDSTLVAKAIEKRHDHLMRDIAGYIANMEDGAPNFGESSGELKIEPSDFFIPSTYTSDQNKEIPCYLLTKKGCDMVANKMTGKKGVLFTAAYVTAFEKMREHIQIQAPKSAMDMLKLQSQALFEVDERVSLLEDKVDKQMTINHNQQRTLQRTIARRVYERAAQIYPASEHKSRVPSLYSAIYRELKDKFGVASYCDIRPADYKSAVAYAENWIEPAKLRQEAS